MVLIIIATRAGTGVLSAIRPKLLAYAHHGRFSQIRNFPSYRGGTSRMRVWTGATSLAPLALRLLRSEDELSLPCPQFRR
jgi:hypothetical protein